MIKRSQFPLITVMTAKILLLFLLLSPVVLQAQYKLTVKINTVSGHPADSLYIAGNFNDWNPANEKYLFKYIGNSYALTIPELNAGTYQFKLTRGEWKKVEKTAAGNDIENRLIHLSSDSTIQLTVEAWADDFAERLQKHTASENVRLVDSAFFMPQLYRTRRIWIYLPPGYNGKKKYPVLYMQDGQNLFDVQTSVYGEWGIDECLDSLTAAGKPGCIVVGIDNGPKRMNEYNPYDFEGAGPGEGDAYLLFITETLKPFIDSNYSTLTDQRNTFIGGSSMGGLISYYAMLKYPDVFGKAGIFSPAFWVAPQMTDLTDSLSGNIYGQFFFYSGENESTTMMKNMIAVTDKLGKNSNAIIYTVTDPLGKHNEAAWHKWFTEFYLFIMGNGLSYQVKLPN